MGTGRDVAVSIGHWIRTFGEGSEDEVFGDAPLALGEKNW